MDNVILDHDCYHGSVLKLSVDADGDLYIEASDSMSVRIGPLTQNDADAITNALVAYGYGLVRLDDTRSTGSVIAKGPASLLLVNQCMWLAGYIESTAERIEKREGELSVESIRQLHTGLLRLSSACKEYALEHAYNKEVERFTQSSRTTVVIDKNELIDPGIINKDVR